jgi:hypothetical protein
MFAAWTLSTLLGALGLLHLYWTFGGRWAFLSSVPKTDAGNPLFLPGRTACLAVAFALASASGITLWSSFRWRSVAMYGIAVVFALRAFGDFRYSGWTKRVHGSDFATLDTWLYSPLCLMLAILAWASV